MIVLLAFVFTWLHAIVYLAQMKPITKL